MSTLDRSAYWIRPSNLQGSPVYNRTSRVWQIRSARGEGRSSPVAVVMLDARMAGTGHVGASSRSTKLHRLEIFGNDNFGRGRGGLDFSGKLTDVVECVGADRIPGHPMLWQNDRRIAQRTHDPAGVSTSRTCSR